MKTIL
jgi:hypothetical protein